MLLYALGALLASRRGGGRGAPPPPTPVTADTIDERHDAASREALASVDERMVPRSSIAARTTGSTAKSKASEETPFYYFD
jgi:hypothetical protein